MVVQPGLCRTWSETPKTGFLRTRLIYTDRPSVFCSCISVQFENTQNRCILADISFEIIIWKTQGEGPDQEIKSFRRLVSFIHNMNIGLADTLAV